MGTFFELEKAKAAKMRGMGSAFHQLCPRYNGTLTPTARTAIRLRETCFNSIPGEIVAQYTYKPVFDIFFYLDAKSRPFITCSAVHGVSKSVWDIKKCVHSCIVLFIFNTK